MESSRSSKSSIAAIIIISALGYFVDIYDLILFSIVRKISLASLGIAGNALTTDGLFILNMQMAGMLAGGILWGIMGDKKGRISVLFGSILLYSIANIANGFVQTIPQYAIMRFIAGVGLAGELGAGITLVAEVMPKETRGYGTMIVATIGILGAVAAGIIGESFDWRIAYFIGGGLGIALLIMRIGVYESGMYNAIKIQNVRRGNFLSLFTNLTSFLKYIKCITIGVPIWFIVAILITFAPEFSKQFGFAEGEIVSSKSVMFCYTGLAIGDFLSGFLSQILKSRKKIIEAFIILEAISVLAFLFVNHFTPFYFYAMCMLLGISGGYWAVFVTNASEQFGINIRATVTTTVPNFVRGAVVPVSILFEIMRGYTGMVYAALIVGFITIIIAYISVRNLDETYGKDLNFLEVS